MLTKIMEKKTDLAYKLAMSSLTPKPVLNSLWYFASETSEGEYLPNLWWVLVENPNFDFNSHCNIRNEELLLKMVENSNATPQFLLYVLERTAVWNGSSHSRKLIISKLRNHSRMTSTAKQILAKLYPVA